MVLSNNGSQLVSAECELQDMIKGWDVKQLKELSAEKGMKWQFSTLAAPHQNGCAESLVKSTKIALKRGIGEQVITPFELYTCLLEETLSILLYNCEYSWVVDHLSSPTKQQLSVKRKRVLLELQISISHWTMSA